MTQKQIIIFIKDAGEFNIRTFKNHIINLLDYAMIENKDLTYDIQER